VLSTDALCAPSSVADAKLKGTLAAPWLDAGAASPRVIYRCVRRARGGNPSDFVITYITNIRLQNRSNPAIARPISSQHAVAPLRGRRLEGVTVSTDKTIAFGPAALYCGSVGDCRPGEWAGRQPRNSDGMSGLDDCARDFEASAAADLRKLGFSDMARAWRRRASRAKT
jgi:hypothetical protein